MKFKKEIDLQIPITPNFFRDEKDNAIPITEIPDDIIMEIAKAWGQRIIDNKVTRVRD